MKLDCSDVLSIYTKLRTGMRSDETAGNGADTTDKLAACVGSALNWIPCSYLQRGLFFSLCL